MMNKLKSVCCIITGERAFFYEDLAIGGMLLSKAYEGVEVPGIFSLKEIGSSML